MSEERYRAKHAAEIKKKNIKPTLVLVGVVIFSASVLFILFFASANGKGGLSEAADFSAEDFASLNSSPAATSEGDLKAPVNTLSPADTTHISVPVPFIYEKNAEIFIASGKNTVKLGSRNALFSCYEDMDFALSEDNRFLYYIEGINFSTGQGTLKKVSADGLSSPITVEDNVCAAEVSPYGGSVMYIKNIEGVTGELYILQDGKHELIDKNVLPVLLRFSQDGRCISYIVRESNNKFALYVKKSGAEPMLVTRATAEAVIDNGINLSHFIDVIPFGDGQVLFSVEKNYNMPLYFYNTDGKTEMICSDAYILKTYPEGGVLYADIAQNSLWYKASGTAAVNISENYGYSRFPEGTDRFLLMEHNGDGINNTSVMMYEIGEDKKKTAISLAENHIFEINDAFDCVVYERSEVLYASRKTDKGWREIYLAEAPAEDLNAGATASGMVVRFDGSGSNLYFFNQYKCGPLYRYSLESGVTQKLLDNVDSLYVSGSVIYAHTAKDKLYRVSDSGVEMICEGIRDVKETYGGAYLLAAGSLRFIASGTQSDYLLDSFTEVLGTTDSIEYRAPLEEDLSAAFRILSGEANFCLYKLGVYKDKITESINIHDALTIAQKIVQRADISETERTILQCMVEGFKAYEENALRAAKASLKKAVNLYSEYLNKQ